MIEFVLEREGQLPGFPLVAILTVIFYLVCDEDCSAWTFFQENLFETN